MKDYQKHIRDLGFEVLGRVKPTFDVFKISKDGSLFTFKPGWKPYSFRYEQVITENKTLDRIGRVDGIVEKVSFHEFNKEGIVALVRKYVEGEDLIGAGRKIVYPNVLVNAVNTLHENGVVIGDLQGFNIVLDPTGKPVIIDLGASEFKEEIMTQRAFSMLKNYDIEKLNTILRRYT